jgi:hypothetical protein
VAGTAVNGILRAGEIPGGTKRRLQTYLRTKIFGNMPTRYTAIQKFPNAGGPSRRMIAPRLVRKRRTERGGTGTCQGEVVRFLLAPRSNGLGNFAGFLPCLCAVSNET